MSEGVGAIALNDENEYILHRWTKSFVSHDILKVFLFVFVLFVI